MPVAVITGSSSGIGLATAKLLASQGYSIVLHGNANLAGLHLAARTLKLELARASRVLCVTADVACPRACRDLVQTCFEWSPQIDLWVNNAGADVLTGAASEQQFDDKLCRLIEVDLKGTIRLSRWVAEKMLEMNSLDQAPSIINMSWDQALLGMEGDPGQLFCTSKAAVAAFTSSLALTVAPAIRVNTVAPGWIRTAWGDDEASSYWNRRATTESQMERWGTVDDVAQTIAWLASPHAKFICGQTINVNGGRRFYPAKD